MNSPASPLSVRVLASREPFAAPPRDPADSAIDKVLRWAIRYCSDMGAGPTKHEWDALRIVAGQAEEIDKLTRERDLMKKSMLGYDENGEQIDPDSSSKEGGYQHDYPSQPPERGGLRLSRREADDVR